MSDIAVYIVDVKQFATIAQLTVVIEDANVLIRRVVDFFNKHKGRGIFSKCSPIDSVCSFTNLKLDLERVISAFPGKEQEELEELQSDFDRFRSTFDRGVSVQGLITAADLRKLITELGMFISWLRAVLIDTFDQYGQTKTTKFSKNSIRSIKPERCVVSRVLGRILSRPCSSLLCLP